MTARDYRKHSKAIAGDLATQFDQDPDAFDILLYKPDLDSQESVTSQTDVVGSLESDERALEYADPIPSRAVRVPFEFRFLALEEGDAPSQDSQDKQPVILLIKEPDVPKQSVIQFEEYVDDENTRIATYYVLYSEAYGQAPVITYAHYCVPMGDDDAFQWEGGE